VNSSRPSINYLYFGIFFLTLVFISAGNIFDRGDFTGSRFYFFLYAFGQAFLEVTLFVFIADLLKRVSNRAFYCFIGFTFAVFILHSLDFMMSRVLDISIFRTVKIFVLDETFENFLTLLDASGVPNWVWLIFFSLIAMLPMVGVLLYRLSAKLVEKKPLYLRRMYFLQAFVCIPTALAVWDFSAGRVLHPDAYTSFIKAIPWKCTFTHPDRSIFQVKGPIKTPKTEAMLRQAIALDNTVLKKKPNIYLFVIESLREDSITEEIAPNLHQFKQDYTHFDLAVSNGNASNLSLTICLLLEQVAKGMENGKSCNCPFEKTGLSGSSLRLNRAKILWDGRVPLR
jgi:hypothetical protein